MRTHYDTWFGSKYFDENKTIFDAALYRDDEIVAAIDEGKLVTFRNTTKQDMRIIKDWAVEHEID